MLKVVIVLIIDAVAVFACWRMIRSIIRPTGLKTVNPLFVLLIKDFIAYCLIGTTLFLMGFGTDFYLYRLANDEARQIQVWIIVLYCMLVVFAMLALLNAITKQSLSKAFASMKRIETDTRGDLNTSFWIWLFLIEELLFYVYYCFLMGYFPFIKMFTASGYELSALRFQDKFNYTGNSIIRNVSFWILPFLTSYASFILLRKSPKSAVRRIQFYLAVLLAVLCLTSRYEKSYLIYFLIGFLLLPRPEKVQLQDPKAEKRQKRLNLLAFVLIALFAVTYVIFLTDSDEGSALYRIIYSEIIGLYGHLIVFPAQHSFLNFAHYPGLLAKVLGKQEIRSSRIVMQLLNNSRYAGHANSLFVAEAYANGGWIALIIAPFIVAISIFIVYYLLSRLKKGPMAVAAMVYFAINTPICGGFLDFIYNPTMIIVIILVVVVNYVVFVPKATIRSKTVRS